MLTSKGRLGGVISASGSITSEVNRRLVMAKADFDALNRVWQHAHLACANGLITNLLGLCGFGPDVFPSYSLAL